MFILSNFSFLPLLKLVEKFLGESKILQYFANMTNHTGLWETELACYSQNLPHTTSESMVLSLPNLAWSSRFLQNFLNPLVTLLWSTVPWPSAQKNVCVCFCGIMAQFKLMKQIPKFDCYIFICMAFKSHMELHNVSAH